MDINKLIIDCQVILQKSKIPNPRMEANLIISDALKIDSSNILLINKNLNESQIKEIFTRVKRRAHGEPYAYISGSKNFYNLNILVNKDVLIPRYETEHLVEEVLKNIKKIDNKLKIIDIGTGSGAILCALLCQLTNSYGVGTDISKMALMTANKNLIKYNLKQRSLLVNTDWSNSIGDEHFDVLTCNPPYVEEKYMDNIQIEIKKEPSIALNGGKTGLDAFEKLLPGARRCLKMKGMAFFEIGYNQSRNVTDLISANNFKIINITKDLSGIERVIFATAI